MKKTLLTALIVILVPLSGISIDMFTPSLPAIQRAFTSPETLVKLTISLYLIGYAIGQLVAGILADSLGRRPILLWGLAGYVFASFAAAKSSTIYFLLLFRCLQGFFVGGPGIMFKVLISDNYKGDAFKNVNTIVFSVWSVSPIVAPYFGGYIQHYFNWQTNFTLMGVYALLVLMLEWWLLPETAPTLHPLNTKTLSKNIKAVMTHKIFFIAVIQIMIMAPIVYLFNAAGPFLFQVNLGFNPIQFGQVALLLGVGILLGVVINRLLLRWLLPKKIVVISTSIMILVSVYFAAIAKTVSASELTLIIFLLFIQQPIIALNNMMKILSTFTETAGLAAALMSALFVGGSGLIVAFASTFKLTSALPLAITYVALTVLSLLLFVLFQRETL